MQQKINPTTLQSYLHYIELLKKKIELQEIEVQKAYEYAEEKRTLLAQAVQERKMLEKLKEKEQTIFRKEELLAEQKFADEIVSFKFNKASKEQ